MSVAKLTLMGMWNYDKSVLDGLKFEEVDSDTLKNILLMECGEFELLYPDLEFMKAAMSLFSQKWKWTVKKWTDVLKIKYAPLENYDRFESYGGKETVSNTGNSVNKHEEENNFSRTGSDSNNVENTTSAYNSNTYQPNNKTDNTTTYGLKENNKNNVTDTVTPNLTETRTPELENHIHGNIGVTTSQQMLKSELDLALWNLYENIINLFKAEYCIIAY